MKYLSILFALLIPSLLLCQDVEDIFKVVEEMPRFPGCEDIGDKKFKRECSNEKLIEFIYQTLEYPAEAKTNKIEGTVVLQFVVDKDGSITKAKIIRDIGGGCGQAALKVVNTMTKMTYDTITTFDESTYSETVKIIANRKLWRPGYQRGIPVKVLFTLPINFKLEHKDQTIDEVEVHAEKSPETWTNFPPEYRSYQHYKDEVVTPTLVKEVYKVEPIEADKIVGDIIPYGEAMHPILHKMGRHNGIDFRAVPGVAIMATAIGTVEEVGYDHERYGQFVTIKHSEETKSLYAHMSSIHVFQGQSVKAGEQIGDVGMSGAATYPHLHYEVHVNGQTENPITENRERIKAKKENLKSSHLELSNTKDLKPLIVVDGEIQVDVFDIEMLRPEDIKTINVLKDHSAIAKYGEAATNGVVEITLKTSSKDQLNAGKLTDVQFDLQQNYPNPVAGSTTISFHLPNDRPASLLFYNQAGQYLYGIKDSFRQGLNEVSISTVDLNTSGVIYYFLIQDQLTAVKKMLVSKY